MKRSRRTTVTLAAVAALAAGLSGEQAATHSAARAAMVKTATLGRIIVDGHGRTLYLFEKDKRGRSACIGACELLAPAARTRQADGRARSDASAARRHAPR